LVLESSMECAFYTSPGLAHDVYYLASRRMTIAKAMPVGSHSLHPFRSTRWAPHKVYFDMRRQICYIIQRVKKSKEVAVIQNCKSLKPLKSQRAAGFSPVAESPTVPF
jgi:hypothetical protein